MFVVRRGRKDPDYSVLSLPGKLPDLHSAHTVKIPVVRRTQTGFK